MMQTGVHRDKIKIEIPYQSLERHERMAEGKKKKKGK